jgi:hypothetical protein
MTNRNDTLPLSPTDTNRTTAALITARALRRSLFPGFELEEVATELAALAHHRRQPINLAISRLDRARTGPTSQVVERAQLALVAALELSSGTRRAVAA